MSGPLERDVAEAQGGVRGLRALSWGTPLPAPPPGHQPRGSPSLSFWTLQRLRNRGVVHETTQGQGAGTGSFYPSVI